MNKIIRSGLLLSIFAVSIPSHALINLGFAKWEIGPFLRAGNLKDLNSRSGLDPTWSRYYGLGISNHFHFSDLMLSADLSLSRKKIRYASENVSTRSSFDLTLQEIELPVLIWNVHDLELMALRYGAGVSFLRGQGKVKSHTAVTNKGNNVLVSSSSNQTYTEAQLKQNYLGLSAGFGVDFNLLLIKMATDVRYTYVPNRGTGGSNTNYHAVELMLGVLL